MVSPSKMKETINDVYSSGFERHINNILLEQKDRESVFFNKDPEYISEAILEAYYCSINIQKNITDYPQILCVRIEHCEMSGDLQLYFDDYDGEKSKHHLVRNCWVDYIIEYHARMYSAQNHIDNAIESFMECYCGIKNDYYEDDADSQEYKNDMDKLIDLYALVRYYCEDIYFYKRATSEGTDSYRRVVESAKISGLDRMIADKFPVKLQFSEKDLKNERYNSPLNLFRAWENDHQFTDIDFKYIQTFNIVIHFSALIEEYKIFRRSYLYYDDKKGGFVHVTEDNGTGRRIDYDQKIYSSVEEVNELISKAKKHTFKHFALVSKDEIPKRY